jgi:hypothetical protein
MDSLWCVRVRSGRVQNGFFGIENGFSALPAARVKGRVGDRAAERKWLWGSKLRWFVMCPWSVVGTRICRISEFGWNAHARGGSSWAHRCRGQEGMPQEQNARDGQ